MQLFIVDFIFRHSRLHFPITFNSYAASLSIIGMMDNHSPKSPEVLTSNANARRSSTQLFGNRRNAKRTTNGPESKENVNVNIAASDTESYQPRTNTSSHQRSHTLASSLKSSDPGHQRMHSAIGTSPGSRADTSPRDTRIPRPKTTVPFETTSPQSPGQSARTRKQPSALRQPMSLKAAFKLAQEQQSDDNTIDLNQAFKMASAEANRGIDGSPSPAPRVASRNSRSASRPGRESHGADPLDTPGLRRGNELGQHLQKFDRNHQLAKAPAPLDGLFTKNRVGQKGFETGNTFARRTSGSSLGSNASNRGLDQGNSTPISKGNRDFTESTTPAGEPQIQGRHPLPSIELEYATSDERLSPNSHTSNFSPEKSFNWHLDADFTAGDLQVSNSPRIRTGKASGGSPDGFSDDSPRAEGTPRFRRSNNRLERLREREAEVQSMPLSEDTPSPPKKNTKLDEIRAREIEALSRRAVATSRLDEIKLKNSEARSESPETDRRSSRDSFRESSLGYDGRPGEKQSVSDQKVKENIDPSISNFNNLNNKQEDGATKKKDDVANTEAHGERGLPSQGDSHDLLRRLARATSASPTPPVPSENIGERLPTQESSSHPKPEETERSRPRSTREERRSRIMEIKGSRERPTVGFVGLERAPSSDSLQSKPGSMPTSEIDPTDRIEAEMKLFALMDGSERGSVRGPSPYTPDETEEETPRPTRIDPTTLPTPRVTGAYVETPATIRVKDENDLSDKVVSDSVLDTSRSWWRRARKSDDSEAPTKQAVKSETQEGPNGGVSATGSKARSSSAPGVRRARSACRRRRRPLINTAKRVSAKDDLRAILRRHEIDDSTLEDFEERLAKHEIDQEELEQMVEESTLKVEEDANNPELTESERELEPFARLGKSLNTLLTGIRSTKHGIERLEGTVTLIENKSQVPSEVKTPKTITPASYSPDSAAVLISLPPLWRRNPKFKLTTLGLVTILLAIWWPLELVFAHYYAVPEYACIANVPCDRSPHDPHYPYTMPFMLDEWVTGGTGRTWAIRAGEELGDLAAEVSDWLTNVDFTQRDERYMNVWERKRHHRRLQRHGRNMKWTEPPGYKSRWPAWEAARRAREEAGAAEPVAAQEWGRLGYADDVDDDNGGWDDIIDDDDDVGVETMSADESVSWW